MRSVSLLLATVALTWVAAAEATVLLGALVVGGLAALKGAAIVGYAAGRHHRRRGRYYRHHHYHHGHGRHYGHSYGHKHYRRYGRAIQTASDEGENLLLSTVGHLDPSGCILKMLCHLQMKEDISLTLEESVLVDMFSNDTEVFAAQNSVFVTATEMGSKTKDPSVCEKSFPRCYLSKEQLGGLLQQAWGCQGFDFFGEEQDYDYEQETESPADQQEDTIYDQL